MPVKAIIFDVGRVIVRINLNRLLEPLAAVASSASNTSASSRLSPQEVWRAIESDPRWNDWQEGRMTPQEWHEYLTGRLRVNVGFAAFCDAWNRALDPDLMLDESLFERLAKHRKLGLLSNTDPLHSKHLENHFHFVRHFPVRVYSCGIGASKPSPAIYRAALEALGVTAADALYIDDIAAYALAAQQLGLEAIHFESAAQLLAQLSSRGLLGS